MLKPLSELVQKPRRVQTGFREAKRTIVVARYPGVEVNNATHHVDEIGVAPRRCKSHPPRAILPDLFVPFDALTFTRSTLLATVSSRHAIVPVYRYFIMPLAESMIYIHGASSDAAIRFQYALWMHRELEEWYPRYRETRIRGPFGIVLPAYGLINLHLKKKNERFPFSFLPIKTKKFLWYY